MTEKYKKIIIRTTFMGKKYPISGNDLQQDSYTLGRKIIESGFRPDFMIALWRGGTAPGIVIHELLKYCGITTDHISVRTGRYQGPDQPAEVVTIAGLEYIVDHANAEDSLLIVDDVFDSGLSIQKVIETLQSRSRKNTPQDIRVATLHYKPDRNKTNLVPDFYVHEIEADKWIYYPHELEGLSLKEIRAFKGEKIAQIIQAAQESVKKTT